MFDTSKVTFPRSLLLLLLILLVQRLMPGSPVKIIWYWAYLFGLVLARVLIIELSGVAVLGEVLTVSNS